MEQDLSERSERCFLNVVQEDAGRKNVNKKFGFGCMRLPMQAGSIDFGECNRMVDAFMEEGFTYFDTAKGYLGGQSEVAVRECFCCDWQLADRFCELHRVGCHESHSNRTGGNIS